MATLIDTTYFYEDLSIAQLTEAGVQASVTRYIKKYEPELLHQLLGYALYQSLLGDDATARMTDLIEGKAYTNRYGVATRWRGLKEEVDTRLYRSLIACYVYYWYTFYNATVTTGTGEKRLRTENALDADPSVKLVKAWNTMADWACELVAFLEAHADTYPEFRAHWAQNQRSVRHLLTYKNRYSL
jgi:hypothetical protein